MTTKRSLPAPPPSGGLSSKLSVPFRLLIAVAFASSAAAASAQELAPIPEDLLDDDHIREEFGVNSFTAPSIEKIFSDLDKLGNLSYDELKREIPEDPPKDRSQLALALGVLISDAFLIVQAEKYSELTDIGRALTTHAKMLGAGTRVSTHSKSLIENSALGQWDRLKEELAKTQRDVEAEMVLLRDVDAAHLISLGGWLRAFEIATTASLNPFDAEKARVLGRVDIADYFLHSMMTLEPHLQEAEHIQQLIVGIEELRDMLDVPEGKDFTEPEVENMRSKAFDLVNLSNGEMPRPARPAESDDAAPATAEAGAGAGAG